MSETHDTSVQEYMKQLETQKPSFDEIEELYVTHKKNKDYLEALSMYFDAKAYDESVYRDIRDYTKNFSYFIYDRFYLNLGRGVGQDYKIHNESWISFFYFKHCYDFYRLLRSKIFYIWCGTKKVYFT